MTPAIHIIIVTHNSAKELEVCLEALSNQDLQPQSIVVVDSGSGDTRYLEEIETRGVAVIKTDNVGFARANNIGIKSLEIDEDGIVIFLNPDAFLKPQILSKVVRRFESNSEIGCLTGKLTGYDLSTNSGTERIDSTGIFRSWYGRWYDRGQGEADEGQYDEGGEVEAVCGAFMCCRGQALLRLGDTVFDEDFFMYKEDIELCLRLKKHGFKIFYFPELEVYHCRGWSSVRRQMNYSSRYHSARNEVIMYKKHPSFYMLWALAKYVGVRFFRM